MAGGALGGTLLQVEQERPHRFLREKGERRRCGGRKQCRWALGIALPEAAQGKRPGRFGGRALARTATRRLLQLGGITRRGGLRLARGHPRPLPTPQSQSTLIRPDPQPPACVEAMVTSLSRTGAPPPRPRDTPTLIIPGFITPCTKNPVCLGGGDDHVAQRDGRAGGPQRARQPQRLAVGAQLALALQAGRGRGEG